MPNRDSFKKKEQKKTPRKGITNLGAYM